MDTPAWGWIELGQLCLSLVLGFLIGIQRERHHKPAGFTTISIVTVTSTLIMQVNAMLGSGTSGPTDPARLAAAVLTGIGFLGAGVILRTGRSVHGITTAATIWMMAAVGLAVGAGLYIPAVAMVAIVWLCFLLDPWVGRMVKKAGSPSRRQDGEDTPVDGTE